MRISYYMYLSVISLTLVFVKSRVYDARMPRELSSCFEKRRKVEDLRQQVGFAIFINCINRYVANTVLVQFQDQNITEEQLNWIQSLGREYRASQLYQVQKPPRIRREIRVLSDMERYEFFEALNAMKQDTTIKPNKFDVFATLHKGEAIRSAHYGPNFLGWHRVFLHYFELAIQRINPRVTIPYWDSSLDFDMDDPRESVMFSREFIGNGNGPVVTGPFRHWITADGEALRRDVGCPGALIPKSRIDLTMKNSSILAHSEVTESFSHPLISSIEGIHNGVHAWIGGQMNLLETSPQDPIFIMHHAFIDYIWQGFRDKQAAHGIRSDLDYPEIGGLCHSANRSMDGFPWVMNKQGYANMSVVFNVRYQRSPECPHCGWSPYLICSIELRKCVSKRAKDILGHSYGEMSENNFQAYNDANQSLQTEQRGHRFKQPYNSFTLNGIADINRWVFMPVLISYRSSSVLPLNRQQAVLPKCPGYDDTNCMKVYVRSDGLSYKGLYINAAEITESSYQSDVYTVTAFRNPIYGNSKSVIFAYDVYGRSCKARCLVYIAGQPKYKACSGVIQASNGIPLMYFRTLGAAWRQINMYQRFVGLGGHVFLKFVCDNDTSWPMITQQ